MSQNGLIATLPNDNQQLALLTLTEISKNLGVSYDRLLGFANAPGVKDAIGAQSVRGVKGVRYPYDAQEWFANLIRAQDEGLVEPKNAGAWLSKTRRDVPNGVIAHSTNDPHSANRPMAELPIDDFQTRAKQAIKEALVEVIQESRMLPEPDDELLTSDQAAGILKCSPNSVRRYVPPVRRGRYRRSDVLRYIRQLGN